MVIGSNPLRVTGGFTQLITLGPHRINPDAHKTPTIITKIKIKKMIMTKNLKENHNVNIVL